MNTCSLSRLCNSKTTFFIIAMILQGLIFTSAQQISKVNQINAVRQKISPVKVSETELRNIQSAAPVTNTLSSSKNLPGVIPIDVTVPESYDVWEAGKNYNIRWRGANEEVRIDLVSSLTTGGRPLAQYNIVGRAPNTGLYSFKVPYNWILNPFGYLVKVSTLSGKQSGYSTGPTAVYTQPVDLECRIVDAYIKTDRDIYVVYAESDKWLEFNVLIRNKGVQSPVTIENVLVRIIKEPEGIVASQEEWGFSGIYGHEWYKLPEPLKFNISSETAKTWCLSYDKTVNLKNGSYRVEVELDPQNRLGENQQCRDDNKCVKIWQIK
ncbi:MAG: hypothetical protein GX431_13475 [Bacteroidales bacterium]|nr:hypothetical protein [Bacteroidales bacterium]